MPGLLALVIFLIPGPTLADEVARQANKLLAIQFADCVTTHEDLTLPGVIELDPLARPFTHSVAQNMVPAVLINVALRFVLHKHPKLFSAADAIEEAAVFNNLMVWHHYAPQGSSQNAKTTNPGTRTTETR